MVCWCRVGQEDDGESTTGPAFRDSYLATLEVATNAGVSDADGVWLLYNVTC